jgi:hypothetical protein
VVSSKQLDLTPKEFANSSPGFPTLGNIAANIFFYSEGVNALGETLSGFGVQCWLIDPG